MQLDPLLLTVSCNIKSDRHVCFIASTPGPALCSSNSYASGNSQNTGNVLTGVPTTRVLRPPGGASQMSLAWDTGPTAPQLFQSEVAA
ncbi:unnamed protein product [Symbiodinium pilosum]|uniref:Uncharacterized protein n=1 Tax=Symbiodinium pilosum TaxID=2952 RepID=A0A812VMT7_SYMPI|nr:unnamed protein product [Symbiodinium pilosum]